MKNILVSLVWLILLLLPTPQAWCQTKTASWYSRASCKREGTSGILTASGQPYDEHAMTCALPHHRFGGVYQVCGEAGCATVKHTDYGPGRQARARGVVIDLTPAGFLKACGNLRRGICRVEVERETSHATTAVSVVSKPDSRTEATDSE